MPGRPLIRTTDTTPTLRLQLAATTAMRGHRWLITVPLNDLEYDQRPGQVARPFNIKGHSVTLPEGIRLLGIGQYRNQNAAEVRTTVVAGITLLLECDDDAPALSPVPLILACEAAATETNIPALTLPTPEVTTGSPWTVKDAGGVAIGCTVVELASIVAPSVFNPKGTWDADTNTPELESGVGTPGDIYYVTVAGTTELDGVDDWGVNDLALFSSDNVWKRIPANLGALQVINNLSDLSDAAAARGNLGLTELAVSGLGTGLEFNSGNVRLTSTGVSAGTYGDATHVPQVVVDAQGRVTSVTPVAISATGGDTVTNAGTDDDGEALVRDAEGTKEVLRLAAGDNVTLTPTDNVTLTPTDNGIEISATGGNSNAVAQKLSFPAVHGLSRLALRGYGETELTTEFRLDDFADNAAMLAGLASRVNALAAYANLPVTFTGTLIKTGATWSGDLMATWVLGVPLLVLVSGEEREIAADPASGTYTYNAADFDAEDDAATVQAAIRADGTGDGDDAVNVTGATSTAYVQVLEGGTASASRTPDLNDPDVAFDQLAATAVWFDDNTLPIDEWIQYDLGSGNSAVAKGYAVYGLPLITTPVGPPINYKLLASNDGSTWDVLDDRSAIDSGVRSTDLITEPVYDLANSTAYRYYRLEVVGADTEDFQISEFAVWGPPVNSFAHTLRYAPSEGNIADGSFSGTNAEITTPVQGGAVLATAEPVSSGGGGALPVKTTAERDALTGLSAGYGIFNSDNVRPEWWSGAFWVNGAGTQLTKPPAGAALTGAAINSGLLRRFLFNEGTGTTLTDLSPSGEDMTIDGATWISLESGPTLFFDTLDMATGNDTGLPTGDAERTIAIRVLMPEESTAFDQVIFTYGTSGNAGEVVGAYLAAASVGRVTVQNYGAGIESTREVDDGGWHTIVLTIKAQGPDMIWRTYIDGTLDSAGALATGTTLPGIWSLGGEIGPLNVWSGWIDSLAVWDHALTALEVQQWAANPWIGVG